MKKLFLLLSAGFFLSTFSVIGQEQQKENKEPEKIKVSKSEKVSLKGGTAIKTKKANINKSEVVQRKNITSKELMKPKDQK